MGKAVRVDQGAASLVKKDAKTADPAIAETYSELTPSGKVKFWLSQIEQREKDQDKYIKDGRTAIKVYRTGSKAKGATDSDISRFNILAANVDVLMPATYSATPKPDVRRRFAQADETGRIAAEVLERSLEYENDQFDVDHMMEAAVMDMLLPGRGTCRVMYEAETETASPGDLLTPMGLDQFSHPDGRIIGKVPDGSGWGFAPDGMSPDWTPIKGEPEKYNPPNVSRGAAIADNKPVADLESDPADTDDNTAEWYLGGTPYPHVVTERAWFEHVNWQDYLQGDGRIWSEVPWVAFRHALTRTQLRRLPISKEVADSVKLDYDVRDDNPTAKPNRGERPAEEDLPFKRGVVWEIWFRETKEVIWIAPSVKDAPLFERAPDVKHADFFPTPRPVTAIENPDDMTPAPEYFVYKGLAEELNRAVRRLQKLVNALKARGIYAGSITDFERVFAADDNQLIPSTTAQQMMSGPNGARSLSDLIWMVPVDKLVEVVQQLYQYTLNVKNTIYEITGISDIARGSTNPNETLGAQQLKAQFASIRIMRRQRNVQRFARDLIRLEADVICQLFGEETLIDITGMQLPTLEEKQIGKAAKLAAAAGQPPPNSLASITPPDDVPLEVYLARPTWDDIMAVLRKNIARSHKIDIETDSTIAADISQQQGAITELVQAIVQFFEGVAPFVATPGNPAGILPPEAAKTILMAAVRRFRMGKEVEEALDMIGTVGGSPGNGAGGSGVANLGPEAQPQEPAPTPPDPVAMAKVQAETQDAQGRLSLDAEKAKGDMAIKDREVRVKEGQLALDQQKFEADQREKALPTDQAAQLHAQMVDEVGQISSNVLQHVNTVAESTAQIVEQMNATVAATAHAVQGIAQEVSAIAAEIDAPAEVLRDGGGNIIGVKKGNRVRTVIKDGKGRPKGLQ